jgi:quinol-cytochrome oxidoreductase complex cytochrome b subunit
VGRERPWRIATRAATWVVGALLVALVATGVTLSFRYRPDVSYANVAGLEHRSILTARSAHRLAAALFVPAVGCLAIASIGLFLARRERGPIAFPLLAGVSALAAVFTGYLLPWDQLSLWAVTVGTDMRGYAPILRGHRVKYVLIGSTEVGTATFSRWFWVHTVLVPLVIVGALTALVISVRRRPVGGVS